MRRAWPVALLASMAVGSTLMLIVGASPGHVWWTMVERVLTSRYQLGQVLYKATGLALTGLAVSIPLDAGLFNIGGEAQLGAGIFTCALVGTALPAGTPAVIAIPACTLAAVAGGALIGWLIGVLRARRDAHEVITSIMFNAIVAGVVLVEAAPTSSRAARPPEHRSSPARSCRSCRSVVAPRTSRCSSPWARSRSCGGCARARPGARRGSRSAAIPMPLARSASRSRACRSP